MNSNLIKKNQINKLIPALILAGLIFISMISLGCSGEKSTPETQVTPKLSYDETTANKSEEPGNSKPAGTYLTPDFLDAVFHEDLAETDGVMFIDTSAVSEGYVAAAGTSQSRLKFQVIFGETKYNYDLPNDGTAKIFPLQSGDGYYSFRIMENIVDSKYALAFETGADVSLLSEFEPYLRPNIYVNYTESSQCVKKCSEFAAQSDSAPEIITLVYDYVCSSVSYDYEKAAGGLDMYEPDPDATLKSGKGICLDYASLAASMLRSQGIPTKLIFGYVAPDDLYHAWNMFYTEETGWVSVEFEINEKNWNRLDLTFSANGSDSTFIGNGTNYADVYQY